MKQIWKKTSHPSSQLQQYYIGLKKATIRRHIVFARAQKPVEKLPIAPNVQSSEKAARTSAAAHSRQLTVVMRCLPTCTTEKSDERFLWTLVS